MRHAGLFAARAVLGGYLAVHGAQKLFGSFEGPGLEATAAGFESLGMKPGKTMAALAGASELGGGLLTVTGVAEPLGPLMIAGTMVVAERDAPGERPVDEERRIRASPHQSGRGHCPGELGVGPIPARPTPSSIVDRNCGDRRDGLGRRLFVSAVLRPFGSGRWAGREPRRSCPGSADLRFALKGPMGGYPPACLFRRPTTRVGATPDPDHPVRTGSSGERPFPWMLRPGPTEAQSDGVEAVAGRSLQCRHDCANNGRATPVVGRRSSRTSLTSGGEDMKWASAIRSWHVPTAARSGGSGPSCCA